MNILFLTDVFYPDTVGGAGRVAYNLSLELCKKGHNVHVITRNPGNKLPVSEEFNQGFNVHRFPSPHEQSLGSLISEIKNSYVAARQLIREIQFDIVCAHQCMVAVGPLFSGILNRVPLIYYFHSPWHEEFLIKIQKNSSLVGIKGKLISIVMRWLEKRVLLKADRTIVLSRYMANKLSGIHGYSKDRIVKIPGGVDLERFCLSEKSRKVAIDGFNIPMDRIVYLTVRNLVPRMGLENLVDAFNQSDFLRQKGLLLIGGKGSLEGSLKEMINSFKLEDCVRLLGYIPDDLLPGTYNAVDFFILPTEKLEGFGLVILEAMSCGTPVIGTPVGAISEVIAPFSKRLLFKGADSTSLKDKLEEIIQGADRYSFAKPDCRRYIEDNFSWGRVADRFEELSLSLIHTESAMGC